ncbi:MAG: UDP-N-acetylglucosamine 1-carboxyvinyltransferase [Lactobacillales bacterium]|jgi:UDP-N-acetylglucosamine 1-carboxyvinyltransferase|nr:UDP-N-acetylglucosamine 1-carboxyvinyltransferase [Lactobacillales bacterium]
MYAFKIKGGKKLQGTVTVKGAKNAVLPLMVAALLTSEPVTLHNVSYLADVRVLSDLLKSLGAEVTHDEESLTICAKKITNFTAYYDYVSKMRASFWVLGALMGRFSKASVSLPGGCTIGARPVDFYLTALEKMGAQITIDKGYIIADGKLHGADILFPWISVGATHNTILSAVLTPGKTTILNPAIEPEVIDLIDLLTKMGADIKWENAHLVITGVKKLKGASHTVIPDRIEAATLAVATALTKGKVFLKGARRDLFESVIEMLAPSNVKFTQDKKGLHVDATKAKFKPGKISTHEYPSFPTDMQSVFAPFFCLADGESSITENIFENRFMHIPELQRMGADISTLDNRSILIKPAPLTGAKVMCSDLRGGAALILAGLVAKGETLVQRIYHVDRGYYKLEEKLTSLGAHIERVWLE